MCDFIKIKHNPEDIEKLKEALLSRMDIIWSPELDYKPVSPSDCWISIKDALPADGQVVIAFEPDRGGFKAIFWDDKKEFMSKEGAVRMTSGVSHWMEWPRPPVAERDEVHDSL